VIFRELIARTKGEVFQLYCYASCSLQPRFFPWPVGCDELYGSTLHYIKQTVRSAVKCE
jgi:hypothetical protein